MERLDFIPSRTVREWLRIREKDFSDMDWAAIIYNSHKPLEEMHRGLKALAGQTADVELKKQIEERLSFDRLCWERFEKNDGSCFYRVFVREEGNPEDETLGHFAGLASALKAGRGQELPFSIEKYQLADLCQQLITPVGYFNPRLRPNAEPVVTPYRGDPIAEFRFHGDSLLWYYTEEATKEERDRVDDWGERRFESRFVPMVNHFDRGEIVCLADDPSWVGIVATSQEEWYELLQGVRERPRGEDFSDASIVVEHLTADGKFTHDHLSPMYLEETELDPNDERTPVLKAMSRLHLGVGSMDDFSLAYEYYTASRKLLEARKRKDFYDNLFHQRYPRLSGCAARGDENN